ncbi:MAG: chemotaxis-specific protein-glutamate methyltransferase CheB [Ghiorsea sp.]
MIRIGLVNHSDENIEALRDMVMAIPGFKVIWETSKGSDVIELIKANKPDLLLLDLLMGNMNGADMTREIMKNNPCPILVMTPSTKTNQGLVFEALSAGAMDALMTPSMDKDEQEKFTDAAGFQRKLSDLARIISSNLTPKTHTSSKTELLIAIGASTGGPKAVVSVLSAIPESFKAIIIIVVHVNQEFAEGMAQWMSSMTGHNVCTAQEGHLPKSGEILLAASNDHLVINRKGVLGYISSPIENPFRPSVDVMFTSLIQHWKGEAVGVLLTGMGDDGALGLKALRQHGWQTLAQDEKSSVIYGMPKAAAKIDAASEILSLNNIGIKLASMLKHD